MADLEDLGFLSQPHTSAGRVPTDRGYRFYVDSLITEEDCVNKSLLRDLHKGLETLRDNIEILFGETTRTISLLSHYLGVAISPKPDTAILKKIELLRYRADKIAAIIFTDEEMIKNKVISLDLDISQKDLNRVAGYLNSEFSGYSFDEIRLKVLKEMSKEKTMCDRLISRAINICREAFFLPYGDLFVAGLSEVLDLPDKHTIIKLLDRLSESDGVQIVIGSENSMDEMKKLSLVVSTCKEDNRPIGVIGIIGPTRMDYPRAISIVDTTAKFISMILAEK
jgi:heat-inducible transcriptional repressor